MLNMFRILTLISLFSVNNCFNFNKPDTNFKFVGDTKPMGFFDPLKLSTNKEENVIKYMREAELHHGRIAMMTSLLLPIIDMSTKDLGIHFFDNLSYADKMYFLFNISFLEVRRLVMNFENEFNIKKDVEPGKYFDFGYDEKSMNQELNNGRLAMIGVLGYIIQELTTGNKIFS